MQQSMKIWNVFNTLTLKQIFCFSKNWSTVFWLKVLRLKTHHFHIKLPYQKPILRQIEWWLQNGPITKNGVFPVTNLFFSKCWFSLRTSYKELICCTDKPNAHICTFCKRWSFIWRCFFPVSILKTSKAISSFNSLRLNCFSGNIKMWNINYC